MKANDLVVGDELRSPSGLTFGKIYAIETGKIRVESGYSWGKGAVTKSLARGTLVAYNADGVPLPLGDR